MGKRVEFDGSGETKAQAPASPAGKEKWKRNRVDAMSHPLRARVLRALFENDVMSPAELSRALRADLGDVSYHVKRLEKLECAELVRTRPVRGALEHFYRATEQPLIETDEFEELDPIMAEDMVLHAVQRIIDDFVASRKAKMVGFDKHFHITRTPRILDGKGYQEAIELFEFCRLEMAEIDRRSAGRRNESGAPGIAVSSSLLLFRVPSRSLDS
jgi:DNA-binding transcriptional ArsR family regulator